MFKVGDKVVHEGSIGLDGEPRILEVTGVDSDGLLRFREGSFVKNYQMGLLSLKDWIIASIKEKCVVLEQLERDLAETERKLLREREKLTKFMGMLADLESWHTK